MLIVLTTTPTSEEAESLANGLVESRLAACVQILPPMRSIYIWKGEVQHDAEQLLLIKTLRERYDLVEQYLLENHSYDEPEIIAIAAEHFSTGYLAWATNALAATDQSEASRG